MSGFVSSVGLCITACICVLLLRQLGSPAVPAVVCIAAVGVLSLVTSGLVPVVDALRAFIDARGAEYAEAGLKIIGVGYLSGICSDVCDTLGEVALGRVVVVAGRAEIIALSLPFFLEIMNLGLELVG